MEKTRHIIIKDFWKVGFNDDKSVAKEDLGWSDAIKEDANLIIQKRFLDTSLKS